MAGFHVENAGPESKVRDAGPNITQFNPDNRLDARTAPTDDLNRSRSYNPDARVRPSRHDKSANKPSVEKTNVSEKKASELKSPESVKDALSSYLDDVKAHSEYPETLSDVKLKPDDIREVPPSENAEMRTKFRKMKPSLINEWERINGTEWPRYKQNVVDDKGEVIRQKGSLYDAHHVHPLSLGGKNTAENITPLHILDHREVHQSHDPKLNEIRRSGVKHP